MNKTTAQINITLCYQFHSEYRNKLDLKTSLESAIAKLRNADYNISFKEVESDNASHNIINWIHETLINSDVVFFDISELNPNVFYEIGFSLGSLQNTNKYKEIILLKNNKSEKPIPFNISALNILKYSQIEITDNELNIFKRILPEIVKRIVDNN